MPEAKGVSLNWSAWSGIAVGMVSVVVTNYVLIMTRVTAIEVRQEYVAKDFEKAEVRAAQSRNETLQAIANLRTDLFRGRDFERYETARPAAAAPEPPAPAPQ